jgi:hypothetical protein
MQLMRKYESNDDGWRYFDLVDPDSGCTRNVMTKATARVIP